jgi:hypothetical protein
MFYPSVLVEIRLVKAEVVIASLTSLTGRRLEIALGKIVLKSDDRSDGNVTRT